MNSLLNALVTDTNYTRTENGALTHKTTRSDLLDMFALGGAYRQRSEEDCILLFKNALAENEEYALKCLFYLRDVRGGQGERRFFRVCLKWLANEYPAAALRNLRHVPEYGRWDDLYYFCGTSAEAAMFNFIKEQLALDVQSKTPSLLAKWLKSENTSSAESRALGAKTRRALGMTPKQYRKTLSILRQRINVLERIMSEGRWEDIEFDKIPSKAGLIYRNAFARHDVERMKAAKDVVSYEDFAKDTSTKVNASTLYPCDVVHQATEVMFNDGYWFSRRKEVLLDDTDRLMVNKYWDNLTDYFNGATLDALCVCDTSGSMTMGGAAIKPIDVAIALSLYCADKAKGPFAGHYISFSSRPRLIRTEGVDFCDKVARIYEANLCDNTNIEAVFDLLLDTALRHNLRQEDLMKTIIIVSDMQFDKARDWGASPTNTLMENIAAKWERYGYYCPNLVFWNVNARNNAAFPMETRNGITYVSGYSPVILQQVMEGKTGYDLMMEKLGSSRYEPIH